MSEGDGFLYESLERAREQGALAAKHGLKKSDNPYPKAIKPKLHQDWNRGFKAGSA